MKPTIFYHGQIRPRLQPEWRAREAIYVESGKIVALGTVEEIFLQYGRPEVQRIDLEGGFVYPGWVDSHMHLSLLGQKLRQLDLRSCHRKEQILAKIGEQRQRSSDEWIIGEGWDENQMETDLPTLAELDEASGGQPLMLTRVCHHVFLLNTEAWRRRRGRVEERSVGRDEQGNWNGLIYEEIKPFQDAQPIPGYEEKKETLRQAMEKALSMGLTAVHTEDMRYIQDAQHLLQIYQELFEEGVYLRTHQLIDHHYQQAVEEQDRVDNDWFRLGAIKIFADGTLGGRTAWLSQPYTDAPTRKGMAIYSPQELDRLVQQAMKNGWPVAVHAIGDQAIDEVLQVMQRYPTAPNGSMLRHRLIHGLILRPDLVERMKTMRIAVDIQPHFVISDFPWVMERIGQERANQSYLWKTLEEEGIPCAGGSDAPIEPLHPLLGMHAAITRRPLTKKHHAGHHPEQRFSRLQAVRLFSEGPAYAAGEERQRGSITVGKQADFTVLKEDLFATQMDQIPHLETTFTIVNGQIAYRK